MPARPTATGDIDPEFDFEISSSRPPDLPTVPFTITDPDTGERERFVLNQPKMTIAIGMIDLIENRAVRDLQDFGVEMSRMLWSLVNYVQTSPRTKGKLTGRARLIERLNDPADGMDIMDVEPIFRGVVTKMFERRPTGPSPASTAKRGTAGRGSAAASRGRRAATSGTSRRASS